MTVKLEKIGTASNENEVWKTLPEFRPNLGSPYEIILHNAVRQCVDVDSGKVIETEIPNFGGLLKEIAAARVLHPRKLSAADIAFVRKAINLKGIELASLLGVSPEHLSRCENGSRVLSPSAEKLFRVIVLKKRFNLTKLTNILKKYQGQGVIDDEAIQRLTALNAEYGRAFAQVEQAVFGSEITAVHDSQEALAFSFRLKCEDEILGKDPDCGDESHDWTQEAA